MGHSDSHRIGRNTQVRRPPTTTRNDTSTTPVPRSTAPQTGDTTQRLQQQRNRDSFDTPGTQRTTDATRNGREKTVTGYQNGRAFDLKVSEAGSGQYLRKDAAERYRAMDAAARRDGVNLQEVSGYRTNREQAVLRARYGPRRAERPGYSNHQRGLSMDIAVKNRPQVQRWLQQNAGKYGFAKDTWEPWHFTYTKGKTTPPPR